MRNLWVALVGALAAVIAVAAVPVAGQAPAYKAPRTPDGRPNLNGICHEGNYAISNVLRGARAQEKATEEAAIRSKVSPSSK